MNVNLVWLYPDLMDTYGDRGNISVLEKRAFWRGVSINIIPISLEEDIPSDTNLIFMGGAQDKQQKMVLEDLKKKKAFIEDYFNGGGVGLFVCAGMQMLGNFYRPAEGADIEGLGLFDLHTIHPGEENGRLIGNVVVESSLELNHLSDKSTLVGFENHGGRTYLDKNAQPLGRVVRGQGNNGEDGTEGVVKKNFLGSYLHGPLLPKNPHLADYLLLKVFERQDEILNLQELDDSLEWLAHEKALTLS